MALIASQVIGSEMNVVNLVASIALRIGIYEPRRVLMAHPAICQTVLVKESIIRISIVVEKYIFERFFDMTGFTFVAIKSLVALIHVIAFVAGVTRCADFLIDSGTGMAAVAFDLAVRVPQRIMCVKIMFEETWLESALIMTGVA